MLSRSPKASGGMIVTLSIVMILAHCDDTFLHMGTIHDSQAVALLVSIMTMTMVVLIAMVVCCSHCQSRLCRSLLFYWHESSTMWNLRYCYSFSDMAMLYCLWRQRYVQRKWALHTRVSVKAKTTRRQDGSSHINPISDTLCPQSVFAAQEGDSKLKQPMHKFETLKLVNNRARVFVSASRCGGALQCRPTWAVSSKGSKRRPRSGPFVPSIKNNEFPSMHFVLCSPLARMSDSTSSQNERDEKKYEGDMQHVA